MTKLSREAIEESVKSIVDPHAEKTLGELKAVKHVGLDSGQVSVSVSLGYPAKSFIPQLKKQIEDTLNVLDSIDKLEVDVDFSIQAYSVQKSLKPMENIKNVIAVASGKGGCLLYTSPSPRDRTRSRMPSSA